MSAARRPTVSIVTLSTDAKVRLAPACTGTLYEGNGGHSGGLPIARVADKGETADGGAIVETIDGTALGLVYQWSDGRWTTQRITGQRMIDGRPWLELASHLHGAPTRRGAIEGLVRRA